MKLSIAVEGEGEIEVFPVTRRGDGYADDVDPHSGLRSSAVRINREFAPALEIVRDAFLLIRVAAS